MYYASVDTIALIVHIIINFGLMKKGSNIYKNAVSQIRYRRFLIALLLYYCSDILWGLLYEKRWIIAAYIDTLAVFFTMVLSVLLWTRSVVSFTNSKIDANKSKNGMLIACGMAVYDANIDESYTDVFTRADKIMYERKERLKSNS